MSRLPQSNHAAALFTALVAVLPAGCLIVTTPELITLGATVVDTKMPDIDYCSAVTDWAVEWIAFEDEVLELVNERRSEGADCGSEGVFPPTTTLTTNSALRCAARNHSLDMEVRDYFGHTNPDGENGGDRITTVGYEFSLWGENIARGQRTPEEVMAAWMSSDGHCANIMNEHFTELGVGYYSGHHWTQAFGAPW